MTTCPHQTGVASQVWRAATYLALLTGIAFLLAGCGDGDGNGIDGVNRRPIAVLGPDMEVSVGETVPMDGGQSYDLDGDVITYLWTFVSRPAGSNATLSSTTGSSTSFIADVEGDFTVQLTVDDGDATSAAALCTATAIRVNSLPVADAGSDQNVTVGDLVQLDGSQSSDPDGDPLTYSWSIVSRPAGSAATLSSTTVVNPTFTADVEGDYVVELTVNDGRASSDPASVTIHASVTGGTRYELVLSWGGSGTMDGKFSEARGVDIDAGGDIWVADLKNETIQRFDPSGAFLGKFTTDIETAASYDGPTHVAFSNSGYLYAFSTWGAWVARYDSQGTQEYLGSVSYGAASRLDFDIDARNGDFYVVFVGAIGKFGSGTVLWQKQLNDLNAVTVDSQGNVYVVAFPGIQKYDPDGNLVAEVSQEGTPEGTLAVDSSDRVYFLYASYSSRYVKVYDGDLNLLSTLDIDADYCSYPGCQFAVEGNGETLYLTRGEYHVHKYQRQ